MPYTSEEIKKQLDDAIKKIRYSETKADSAETTPGGVAASGETESVQPEPVAETTANVSVSTETTSISAQQEPEKAIAEASSMPQNTIVLRRRVPAASRKTNQSSKVNPTPPGTSAENEKIRSFEISADGVLAEKDDSYPGPQPELDIGPADFKIKFDFESAYRDIPEDNPLRIRREKRTGCVGGILYSAFVICLSLILASLAWLAATDVLGFATADEQVSVNVQRGFTLDDIIDTLYEAGLIKYKSLFRIYAGYSNAEEKISSGTYLLNKNFDYRALVYGMTTRGGVLVETTVTIPEGFTLAEIFMRLEDNGVCFAVDLWEAATNHNFEFSFLERSTLGDRHRLEGFLFPETYNFYLDSSPIQVIDRFLTEFDRRFTETYIERAEDLGYSIRDIIIIASMIEREAGSDEERPRIAAVIYNRLNDSVNFPLLQIDATIGYAIAGTGRQWSLDIDSPYNTYLHPGLPPGPIANPGIESIRAALYPDSTDEYYYALNRQNTHEFFRTLSQHEAFVASPEFGGR